MPVSKALFGVLALAVSTLAAWAQGEAGVTVSEAWARATPQGATVGAVYVDIRAGAAGPDKLVSAATPAAATVEIHTHAEVDGVMRMRRLDGLEIPAGELRKLAPGGLHIMLFDLKGPLVEGTSFPVTFTFEKAGAITVDATVAAIGSMGPSGKDSARTDGATGKSPHQDHGAN